MCLRVCQDPGEYLRHRIETTFSPGCIKLGLPKLREQLSAKVGRVTNVDPLPTRVLERLYRERQDDDSSIRRFIAAQPKDAE